MRSTPKAQQAEALYAYDFPGKYLTPGTITHCPAVTGSRRWLACACRRGRILARQASRWT